MVLAKNPAVYSEIKSGGKVYKEVCFERLSLARTAKIATYCNKLNNIIIYNMLFCIPFSYRISSLVMPSVTRP
jgi:hypothetical protein